MYLDRIKKTSFIFFTCLILSACIPKDVTVYQQEDELLNCPKLTGKLAELMNTNGQINKHTGLENTSLALWYISPPIGVINQINASEGRDNIDDRFLYLLQLKERQGCQFTDKEIAFSKLQGKGRFSEDLEKYSDDFEQFLEDYKKKQMDLKQ